MATNATPATQAVGPAAHPLVPNDLNARGRAQLKSIMEGGITEQEVRMAKDQFTHVRDMHHIGPNSRVSPAVARDLHQADALGRAVQNKYVFQEIRRALTSGDNEALRKAFENGWAGGGLAESLAHMSPSGIHEMAQRLDPNGDGLGSRARLASFLSFTPGIRVNPETRALLDASLTPEIRKRMIRNIQ